MAKIDKFDIKFIVPINLYSNTEKLYKKQKIENKFNLWLVSME